MADILSEARRHAQNFIDLGERARKFVEGKIVEHATTTVPVAAIALALAVLLRKNPKSFASFLEHYGESAGKFFTSVDFPCLITAKELYNAVNQPEDEDDQ